MKFRFSWICRKMGGLALGFNYHFPTNVWAGGDFEDKNNHYKYWFLALNFLVFRLVISNERDGERFNYEERK